MPVERVVEYALSHDLRPSSPARSERQRSAEVEPLSEREAEVAALVARGRTNQEIAADLVISQRTAESHLYHILQKLDLASRAHLAIWAAEHGLLAERSD